MRKIWNWIVSLLYKVGEDKWFHFMAGLILAACVFIVFGWKWGPAAVSFIAGLCKEAFDLITTKVVDWKDLVATLSGGLLIQLFVFLNIWFF